MLSVSQFCVFLLAIATSSVQGDVFESNSELTNLMGKTPEEGNDVSNNVRADQPSHNTHSRIESSLGISEHDPGSSLLPLSKYTRQGKRLLEVIQQEGSLVGTGKDTVQHIKLVNDGGYLMEQRKHLTRGNEGTSDFLVRVMRDQLIVARVYCALALSHQQPHILRDLRLRIRQSQQTLSEAAFASGLQRSTLERIKAMNQVLLRARGQLYDCSAISKMLRAMVQSAEEQANIMKKQTTFLSQLAANTLPKSLHCFSLQLTVNYYKLPKDEREFSGQHKVEDNSLFHYAIFTDNVLAASVVVNSTVSNAKEPWKHVFHIATDKLNYAAMRMWFLTNPPGRAAIEILNVNHLSWLNSSYSHELQKLESAAMKEYQSKEDSSSSPNMKYRNPKYLSILNHLRFYLPQMYPKLDKILFLDDDVVVQKDLTPLWSVDLHENVNGAVEICEESFHRFDKYLNFSNPHIRDNFDPHACGWAYGMNIFDLWEWKKKDISNIYHKWQSMNEDRLLWKLGTLPPGLVTFYNLTYPLEKSWHVCGLGYNPYVEEREIESAGVVHYNGNMKPWLGIGIAKYRQYWAKYVNYDHELLQQCTV